MRKVFAFLAVSLVLFRVGPAMAQAARDTPFPDTPQTHWAYEAVESLRKAGILIGYPDGYFRGKRTLTRYEFAVAVDRALRKIVVPAGPPGQAGERGAPGGTGPVGPAGMVPEEFVNLRKLLHEFRDELGDLGRREALVIPILDQLERAVSGMKDELARRPVVYGGAWVGARSDWAGHPYVDRDGRTWAAGPYSATGISSLTRSPAVLNDLMVGIRGNIAGGAKFDGAVTYNNYISYLGGNSAVSRNGINPATNDTYIHHLEISTPFTALGRGSAFTLGRYPFSVSHLTLWKPTVETYLPDPYIEGRDYYMDGANLTTNFGSVGVKAFGGLFSSVNGSKYDGWNTPLAGASVFGTGLFPGCNKPIGQPNQGQIMVNQLVGLTAGTNLGVAKGGHIGLSVINMGNHNGWNSMPVYNPYIDTTQYSNGNYGNSYGNGSYGYNGISYNQSGQVISSFSSVLSLGATADVKITDHLNWNADWGKTITQRGAFKTVNAHENNAFTGNVGFNSGGLELRAGYRYIDPLFYAPGYWGKIGSWINPTNVQGPTFRAEYQVTPMLGVNCGGDFYTPARHLSSSGGLGNDDGICRFQAGFSVKPASHVSFNAAWEGVYWDFEGPHSWAPQMSNLAPNARVHPTENYLRFSTGYDLTSYTRLKLFYENGRFDGHNYLIAGGNTGFRTNYNAFGTSVGLVF